jgi:uroporphyrin-III C-methyltransferase
MPRDMGSVVLVGAGPGPADLMTVRAQRVVQQAQAVLYDALVSPEVLALAPAICIKIQTGKRAGLPSMNQQTINGLMLKLARQGLRVVRLKGGDPSVFGRSGEETAFLEAHGVPVDIVPGITAVSAAAAQFAFPLTHRGQSRRLVMATARVENGEVVGEGWDAMADGDATLALYMSRDSLAEVAERLIQAGRSVATPALAIENAGSAEAVAIHGDLGTLPALLRRAERSGPVVVVIGAVAALARCEETGSARDALPANKRKGLG